MSGTKRRRNPRAAVLGVALLLALVRPGWGADLQDLQAANAKGQWNDAAEIADEILASDPGAAQARLQGAYALFQKGYSNSALVLLKPLKPSDWKSVPQGADRFAEIISLFQKKVPLTLLPGRLEQVSLDDSSPYLHDEIRFARGRAAFEKRDAASARGYLEAIAKGSRFYPEAHYLLAALDVEAKDYPSAMTEFSGVFQPSVLDQSTEFWRDLGAQMTTHWGANLKVALDTDPVRDSERVGELALLGMARVSYATGQYEAALRYYSRVSPGSPQYSRAKLERIWTELALDRHDDAQKDAAALSVDEKSFEALKARMVRALILTDEGKVSEARKEIDAFLKEYREAKAALENYEGTQVADSLPDFLKKDLADDFRLKGLRGYQQGLTREMAKLRSEDQQLFPVYGQLASQLEPLVGEAKGAIYRITEAHVARRRSDLEELYVQAQLITAEIYLEEREQLRVRYKNLMNNAAAQSEHDRKLVELLQDAVDTVDGVLPQVTINRMRLEYRQAELLWDLSTARGIVAQTTHSKAEQVLSDQLRVRSLAIARKIAFGAPKFERHAQALFFTGYAQIELGQQRDGVRTLTQYVQDCPRDKHVPDAYRILADLQFDANHFPEAERLYEKILAYPDSPVVGYALYKIGWCAYNRKDFARALLGLEEAVRWAAGKTQASQLLSLRRESRHDLISLYAEVGDYRKALDYFSRFFQGDTAGWISDLAQEFDRIGQYEKSASLYRTLIALEPSSMDNVVRQAEIINGRFRLHDWSAVIQETRHLEQSYQAQLHEPQPAGRPAAIAEKTVREVTLSQLYEFRKDPNPDAAARVAELDELYLSIFGNWPSAEEPLYEHGLYLLSQNKLADAVAAFRSHWKRFGTTLKEPVREEALRNLIYALDKLDATDKSANLAKDTPELLAYADAYVSSYPRNKYARPVRFLESTVFFRQGQTEKGIQASQELFDSAPSDDIGKRAFKNLRVAYYGLKDWPRTYRWADQQLKRPVGIKPYEQDLMTVKMEALFQWASEEKTDAKSAELFLQLAGDPGMQKLAQKALFNAFIRYHHSGSDLNALDVANRLQKSFPDYGKLADIAGARASLYQEAGDYAHAYPLLDAFVKSPGQGVDPASIRQGEMNLALISEALGKRAEAKHWYQEYIQGTPPKTALQDAAHVKEAKRGLARLAKPGGSAWHQEAPPEWQGWDALSQSLRRFQKRPLPVSGDLPARIKKGGEELERVAQRFAQASTDPATPAYYAFESYCSLPFLYSSYADAVQGLPGRMSQLRDLKASDRAELEAELRKVTDPVLAKAKALADQCLGKSADARHDGPQYRAVLGRWGWMADANLKARGLAILAGLKQSYPWLDPVDPKGRIGGAAQGLPKGLDEPSLLKKHLGRQATEQSWYALARVRWNPAEPALSRLTLVDGLHLYPASGRILNALAAIHGEQGAYELAAQKGSRAAWANLACLELEGGRLARAESALKQGLAKGSFDGLGDLKQQIQELVGK